MFEELCDEIKQDNPDEVFYAVYKKRAQGRKRSRTSHHVTVLVPLENLSHSERYVEAMKLMESIYGKDKFQLPEGGLSLKEQYKLRKIYSVQKNRNVYINEELLNGDGNNVKNFDDITTTSNTEDVISSSYDEEDDEEEIPF
ncbi:MAG: hypothetical protein ABIK73_06100 [candidate division WOR-3 bacterium]